MGRMRGKHCWAGILALVIVAALGVAAQAPEPQPVPSQYKPQFPGDPARSDSEAQALGYMRVVLRAENIFKKRHGKYAESLAALAGTGSFTKRMAHTTDRGDYKAAFLFRGEKSNREQFALTMTPKHMDSEHRSFYAEEDGAINADDQKPADKDSPKVR